MSIAWPTARGLTGRRIRPGSGLTLKTAFAGCVAFLPTTTLETGIPPGRGARRRRRFPADVPIRIPQDALVVDRETCDGLLLYCPLCRRTPEARLPRTGPSAKAILSLDDRRRHARADLQRNAAHSRARPERACAIQAASANAVLRHRRLHGRRPVREKVRQRSDSGETRHRRDRRRRASIRARHSKTFPEKIAVPAERRLSCPQASRPSSRGLESPP